MNFKEIKRIHEIISKSNITEFIDCSTWEFLTLYNTWIHSQFEFDNGVCKDLSVEDFYIYIDQFIGMMYQSSGNYTDIKESFESSPSFKNVNIKELKYSLKTPKLFYKFKFSDN